MVWRRREEGHLQYIRPEQPSLNKAGVGQQHCLPDTYISSFTPPFMWLQWLSHDYQGTLMWCQGVNCSQRLSARKTSLQSFSWADKWRENKVILPTDIYFLLLDILDIPLLGTFIRDSFTTSKKYSTNTQLQHINKGCKNTIITATAADFTIQLPLSTKVHLTQASWLVCCHDNRVPVEGKLDLTLNVTTSL